MIDYYFSLTSPWAYLGHKTFVTMAKAHGQAIRYFPVFLSDVFQETGGLPLAKRHPARQNYRMLELQRWREKRNLPLTLHPKYFPVDPRLADRIVIALLADQKDPESFIQLGFETVWVHDGDLADPVNLSSLLSSNGFDAERYIKAADSDAIVSAYENNARQAIAAGVIGSPCYVRLGEVFWGQDRLDLLEDALQNNRKAFAII